MKHKTFDEFWAKFLQITFHLNNPDRWASRKRKAEWCLKNLDFPGSFDLIDLGCGDGLLDIWLSRCGIQVTAIDRNQSVIEHAIGEDDTRTVHFISKDLREIEFPSEKFEAALFLETSGLLPKSDEVALFRKIFSWLKPGGKVIVDAPAFVEDSNSWSAQFPEGEVTCRSSFEHEKRLQRIEFNFVTSDGESFELIDPIRDSEKGISRYLYPKDELAEILKLAGFALTEIPHYYGDNYFSLLGTKGSETRKL